MSLWRRAHRFDRARSAADLPDTIWTYDAEGKRLWGRPNFDKPGVAEQVERDAFYGECAARPSGGGLSSIIRMAQINRFEAEQESKQQEVQDAL